MPPCPYHADGQARLQVPSTAESRGWIGWLDGCCGLIAWCCPLGVLQPQEARFCSVHGCAVPPLGGHDVSPARRPWVVHGLPLHPATGGGSTPALAGNVLGYLTDVGEVVAVDLGGTASVPLATGVTRATLRVEAGELVGALHSARGVRRMAWRVREIRDALEGRVDPPEGRLVEIPGLYPRGLPRGGGRRQDGIGALRIEVQHDPLSEPAVSLYRDVTGVPPGDHLVYAPGSDRLYRPQVLHQMPVAVPGGFLVLGRLRDLGQVAEGALLIPTVVHHE